MFEGDFADTCAKKFSLMLRGGQAEGLAYADPGDIYCSKESACTALMCCRQAASWAELALFSLLAGKLLQLAHKLLRLLHKLLQLTHQLLQHEHKLLQPPHNIS